jgi:rhamnulokinase
VVLGELRGDRLALEEVHRAPNAPVRLPDGLYTDILAVWQAVVEGLRAARRAAGRPLAGIAVDGWAVDFGLLDAGGALLANPRHYRDERHAAGAARAFARVPREEVYATTGIQFLPINTLDQLVAMEGAPVLAAAERLLLIPDLIGFWLTGEARAEVTLASTTQLWDPRAGAWAEELIARLGLPRRLLAEPVAAPARLGGVPPRVAAEAGIEPGTPVWVVGAHDTASAVAAVPAAAGDDVAYVSSGTWSLVGVELDAPITSPAARAANLTNEVGLGGTIRLLKNVMGLWLVQECRRTWAREGLVLDHAQASALAAQAPPGGPLVDPDRPELLHPGDMPARLRAACRETGQPEPGDPAAVLRCALESLACKVRLVLEAVERVAGRGPAAVVHVVGGGARDTTLCQLTADVLDRPVHAGPVEATAAGNLLTQALAAGHLGDRHEIRAVVRRSLPPRTYDPGAGAAAMAGAYARFRELVGEGDARPAGPTAGWCWPA